MVMLQYSTMKVVPESLRGKVALGYVVGLMLMVGLVGANWKNLRHLQTIVSSAEQDVEKFLKAGASEVLLKPYDINRLMDILENLKLIEDEIAP